MISSLHFDTVVKRLLENTKGNLFTPNVLSRIGELSEVCESCGIKKPLLVTDRGMRDLPITVSALDQLAGAGLGAALFADVQSNPTDQNLDAGISAFKAGGHDGIVRPAR